MSTPAPEAPDSLIARPPSRAAQLAVVLAVAAAIRIWLICHTCTIAPDGALYVRMAQEWSADASSVVRRYRFHVGYPAAIATVRRVLVAVGGPAGLRGWELSGQIISLAANLAAIAGLWMFAGRGVSWRVAWVSAALLAVGRKWSVLGSDVLTDSSAVCMQIWAAALSIDVLDRLRRGDRRALAVAAGAGAAGALGYLIRPEALLVVPLIWVLWLVSLARGFRRWKLTLGCVAASGAAAALCAAPYVLAIGAVTKRHVMAAPSGAAVAWVSTKLPLAAAIPSLPKYVWWRQLLNKLFDAMNPVLAVLVCVFLATWVAVRVFRLRLPVGAGVLPRRAAWLLMLGWSAVLVPLITGPYGRSGIMSHRYLMFQAVLLAPLAGSGACILARWLGLLAAKARCLGRVAAAAVPVVVLALAAGMLVKTLTPLHGSRLCYREAGEHLRTILKPPAPGSAESLIVSHQEAGRYAAARRPFAPGPHEDFILASNPLVVHYAQARAFLLRREQFESEWAMLARVARYRATHVVFGDRELAKRNPGMADMFRQPVFAELRSFDSGRFGKRDTVRVYRVNRLALRERMQAGRGAR